jgi:hypothetical protein
MPSASWASKQAGSAANTASSLTIALAKSLRLKSNIAASYCSCHVMASER